MGSGSGQFCYGSNNIFIGNRSGYDTYYTDDRLYIDNTSTNTPLIYGNFFNDSIIINGDFYVTGSAGGSGSWTAISDRNLKKDIGTIQNALNKILQLRGVNFKWKNPETYGGGLMMGFIAQEAEKVIPEVVNKPGKHYSMQYAPITALLVEALKEQQRIISNQQDIINSVQEDNTLLKKMNDDIKREVEKIKAWLNIPDNK